MSTAKPEYCMWTVGLEEKAIERIRACLDANCRLRVLPEMILSQVLALIQDADQDQTALLWLGQSFWQTSVREKTVPPSFLDQIPSVLVLSEACSMADLEEALESGFQDLLPRNGKPESIRRIVDSSLEQCAVYRDMERMAREILMNRELLLRKGDVFSFLKDFILRVSRAKTRLGILNEAREALKEVLPVAAMHVALWGNEENGSVPMHLCFDADGRQDAASPVLRAWTDMLLGAVMGLAPFKGATPRLSTYYRGKPSSPLPPDTGRTLLLPLCVGDDFCGILALLLDSDYRLGRDQAQALDAATAHLAGLLRLAAPGRQAFPAPLLSIAS